MEATSAYDTGCLKATLEQLIDFDRINANRMRLSVGARSQNARSLSTRASGALPAISAPLMAPIEMPAIQSG